jgi:glycosyltransferase involved in cell wall biosynthesis
MKTGWLVNDRLTCIPNTETIWHNLLQWIPNLKDKTFGGTEFGDLNYKLNKEAEKEGPPDYIIRNATFFPPLDLKVKTISLLQDYYTNSLQQLQIDVINTSNMIVFNSPFTYGLYKDVVPKEKIHLIPIGTDFNLFKPLIEKSKLINELNILPNSILFVGADNTYPKGFDLLLNLINSTNYNFCLVMKTNYAINHPRIRVFNNVPHNLLVKIYNACDMLICTSRMETLHLAGIEAAACNIPILATNVGIYYERPNGLWGQRAKQNFTNIF